MPVYSYTALSEQGVLTEGEAAAASADELARELTAKGLLVRRIAARSAGFKLRLRRGGRTHESFMLFNQELIALLRAGLTIPDALKLAQSRPDDPALSSVLQRLLEDIRGGSSFSEACARHPEMFDPLYISAIQTGEKTGNLVPILGKYQATLKKRVEVEKKVGQALAYPVFLLITLAVILGVLFMFVMPRFAAMYSDFGAELPLPTRILIGVVHRLPLVLAVIAAVAGGLWWWWRAWRATEAGRLTIDRVKTRLPLVGDVHKDSAIAQLARSLSALLSGGTPLVEAMQTTARSLGNRYDAQRLGIATGQVTEGKSLAPVLASLGLVPATAVKMVEIGEASGNLDGMLLEVAEYYEDLVSNRLAKLMTLIEPILMLLMGILIGGVIIVMYLPIFYMVDIVR